MSNNRYEAVFSVADAVAKAAVDKIENTPASSADGTNRGGYLRRATTGPAPDVGASLWSRPVVVFILGSEFTPEVRFGLDSFTVFQPDVDCLQKWQFRYIDTSLPDVENPAEVADGYVPQATGY